MDESPGQEQGAALLVDAGVGMEGWMHGCRSIPFEESGEEEVQVAGEGQAIAGTNFGAQALGLNLWGTALSQGLIL